MDPILQDAQPVGQSMYCFSVYTKDTGSTKQSHELEILQHQKEQHLGIFQCEYSAVFSDVSVDVGQGMMTKVVTDVEGDWHFAKRKDTGSWGNLPVRILCRFQRRQCGCWSGNDDEGCHRCGGRLALRQEEGHRIMGEYRHVQSNLEAYLCRW